MHRRRTPLHISVKYFKYEVVRLLVANGADATARDNDGFVEHSRRRRCTVGFVLGYCRRWRALGPVYNCRIDIWKWIVQ